MANLFTNKYSNFLILPAFPCNFLSGKTSTPVKNSYLPAFTDDKAEILAFCLFKSN